MPEARSGHGRVRRLGMTAATLVFFVALAPGSAAADGKLLATDGAQQIEGSAGGGLVPWAVIAGRGADREVGVSGFATGVFVDDFQLTSLGAAVGLYDRVEISFAHQRFEVQALDEILKMNVFGLKVKALGDLVYGRLPAIAFGVQAKHTLEFDIPELVGAQDDWGIDYYLSGTRLFLDAVAGRNVLVNATVRASRANELGLLGFGGDADDDYRVLFEGSAAIFLERRLAIGYEYRQKNSALRFADEDAWHDVFVAFVPWHGLKFVASYVRLGEIAGAKSQDGGYLSIQGSF